MISYTSIAGVEYDISLALGEHADDYDIEAIARDATEWHGGMLNMKPIYDETTADYNDEWFWRMVESHRLTDELPKTEYEACKKVLADLLEAKKRKYREKTVEWRRLRKDPEATEGEIAEARYERERTAAERNLLWMLVEQLDDRVQHEIDGIDWITGKRR